jgi:hypothetical protein
MQIEILKLEHDPETGFIKNCSWKATKVSSGNVAESFDFTVFEASSSMIPYADVTEADVLNWVRENMDQEKIEKNLDDQLAAKASQTVAVGFPWRKV